MLTRKLPCPSCGARLKIADDLPTGKKITCPKCRNDFPVPEDNGQASAPKDAAALAPPEEQETHYDASDEIAEDQPVARKRRRRPPAEDDDELDEEVEERPLPRKRRKFKKKRPPSRLPLILGLVIAGVLLLGAGGVTLAVVFWPKENKSASVAPGNPPNRPSRMLGGAPSQAEPAAERSAPDGRSGQPEPTGENSDPFAAGKQVFQRTCARCHRIGGSSAEGGPGGRRGPDLTTIGREHDADWLMAYVRDPTSRKPESRMPAIPPQRLSDEDLRAVAVYLASLK